MSFKHPKPAEETATDAVETEEAKRKRPYAITDEAALYKAAPYLFKQVPNHQAIQAIWKSMPPPSLPGVVAAVDLPPPVLTPLEEAINNAPVERL